MKNLSQRELRNDNARVMQSVEEGESFIVTRRGVPVAQLTPIQDDAGLHCVKPARRRINPKALHRVRINEKTADALADLRGDR